MTFSERATTLAAAVLALAAVLIIILAGRSDPPARRAAAAAALRPPARQDCARRAQGGGGDRIEAEGYALARAAAALPVAFERDMTGEIRSAGGYIEDTAESAALAAENYLRGGHRFSDLPHLTSDPEGRTRYRPLDERDHEELVGATTPYDD